MLMLFWGEGKKLHIHHARNILDSRRRGRKKKKKKRKERKKERKIEVKTTYFLDSVHGLVI
jgi:hypothetical protein